MADRLTQKISHIKGLLERTASGEILLKEVLDKEICSLWEWILFFQQALLKILESTIASVPPQGGRKHPCMHPK